MNEEYYWELKWTSWERYLFTQFWRAYFFFYQTKNILIMKTWEGWEDLPTKYIILIKVGLNTTIWEKTIYKGIGCFKDTQISSKADSTPLTVIHPLWITNWKPIKMNNIELNASKGDGTRGAQGGIEHNIRGCISKACILAAYPKIIPKNIIL